MDKRSWPWKRKSSDKSAAEKAIATLGSAGVSLPSNGSQKDKDNYMKPNYVQISVESYSHLTGLEDQVKAYEEQVKSYEDQFKTLEEQNNELHEKLSAAHSEITSKEELVKQHAKVAEDAVTGWEKAEAEALALKNHLEAVTLQKLTAEDRAAHLDGALKECMRQIRNLKEDHEQQIQDIVVSKNMQYDKIKHDLEAKINEFSQELDRAEADNGALSRSLQERSNMLIKINDEKLQAEAEIEMLKSNIESCEREINSLKYELHIVSKELEIRNEEKNMSVKSAEAANKQQMEGVKKIAKLEAECQRLRGLVRKKLPGPAALAQMKMEVESYGRDYGSESRLRRSPAKPSSPHLTPSSHMLQAPEFSLDGMQKFHRENEFLTERLFAMEEETKMLKEALAKRNTELQTSRSMYAKAASKLQSLEAKHHVQGQQKASPPSMTSMSEDGNDETASCAESWASALISELSHVKDKNKDRSSRTDSVNHLELMDDFLEMEKLASDDSNGRLSAADRSDNKKSEDMDHEINGASVKQLDPNSSINASDAGSLNPNSPSSTDNPSLAKLQSRISEIFESTPKDADVGKILEEIRLVLQEVHDKLHPHSVNCVFEEKHCSEDAVVTAEKEISSPPSKRVLSQELLDAISQIHSFVLYLGKEASSFQGIPDEGDALGVKIEHFSTSFKRAFCNELSLSEFVLSLSEVMAKASELSFNFLGYKGNEAEANSPDCIDKVALPENKVPQGEKYANGFVHTSDTSSNPEVPQEANFIGGLETSSFKCSLEEYEQMKGEKENIERELTKCNEELESTKCQLHGVELQLAEVKSQLVSCQKTNSLADTQLKCMAESYNSLEKRAADLDAEVNLLQTKLESLDNELQAEKESHQDALTRCKDLEEQLQRNEGCSVCASAAADEEIKNKQEKDLADAAEKLAECQETIYLLGRQLKSLRPQGESGSPSHERNQIDEAFPLEEPTTSGTNLGEELDHPETDTTNQKTSAASQIDIYNSEFSPSDSEVNGLLRSPLSSKNAKHRPTKSGSSSTSSTPTPEKHSRGFSRFFSTKGKHSH